MSNYRCPTEEDIGKVIEFTTVLLVNGSFDPRPTGWQKHVYVGKPDMPGISGCFAALPLGSPYMGITFFQHARIKA